MLTLNCFLLCRTSQTRELLGERASHPVTAHSGCTVNRGNQGFWFFIVFSSDVIGFSKDDVCLSTESIFFPPDIPSKCDVRSLPGVGNPISRLIDI